MSEQEKQGRPLPHIDPAPSDNSASPAHQVDLELEQSSGGTRRHASASVSRTSFSANTPASQKRAIQQLRQSLTFSDNSSHSSAASTPQKRSGHVQSGQGSTHSLQGSTQSAPPAFTTAALAPPTPRDSEAGVEEEEQEYVSEGEASARISIPAIMSKLEQVKSYLQEAQALHQQMKERLSEPDMAAQANKMGKLVEDLRRQESGYLTILVKLLDQHKGSGGAATDSPRARSAESEDSKASERETLSDGEVVGEDGAVEKGNDSMSLKAELLKERIEGQRMEREKQEEELRMLRQQRDLLKKLLDQQKQIEALESRQRNPMGHNADDNSTPASPAGPRTEEDHIPVQAVSESSTAEAGQEKEETVANTEANASAIVRRLQDLRARQARVEQLTTLLNQLKSRTENEMQSQVSASSGVGGGEATAHISQPQGVSGSSELVAVGDQATPAQLIQLQQKLREAEEAKTKLKELQELLNFLQEAEGGGSGDETRDTARPTKLTGSQGQEQQQLKEQPLQQQEEEEEEEDVEEEEGVVGDGLAKAQGGLEESVLSEYEERLVRRRMEVRQLQEQRDKLLVTQRKLQQLQQNIRENAESPSPSENAASTVNEKSVSGPTNGGSAEGVLSPDQLASELGKQRRLYDELLDRTQQIQSMVDEVAGTRDMSGATWGGSSCEEEEEEEVTSFAGLDETVEDLDHNETLGSSAVEVVPGEGEPEGGGGEREGEGMVFRVTRHTPRQVRSGQRRLLTPETSLLLSGKRMKLDDAYSAPVGTNKRGRNVSSSSAPKPAAIGKLSAAWPGVIFPSSSSSSSRKQTREEATQTGVELSPQQPLLPEPHLSFLHHQLASSSALAGQLLSQQQTLVGTVCRQLEALQLADRVHDHFARLHQYQAQLEQQYHQVQAAFCKLDEEAGAGEPVVREEEGLDRYQEHPILSGRPSSPQPPFTSTLPTSSPRLTRPHPPGSNNTRGLPTEGGNERAFFEQQTTHTEEEDPTISANQQRSSTVGAQGAYFPQVYQPQSAEDADNVGNEGVFTGPPPPPHPPYFHPSHPHFPPHHYQFPPWTPNTPQLAGHSFPQYPHPSPGLTNLPPFTAGPAHLSWPPPPPLIPGLSPGPPIYHSSGPTAPLNTSGHLMYGSPGYPAHVYTAGVYPFPAMGGGRGRSPSGVTGISMQVQPPSSPPSAPSLTNLPHSSSSLAPGDHNSGSGLLLPQSSSGPLLPPTTSVSHTGPPKPTPPLPRLTTHTHHTHSRPDGGEEGRGKVHTQDEESLSSIPLSLPENSKRESVGGERPPEDFSVFDALRDTIYSEVATLIANNENRPHFLVELFRELQMLSSDYLRQRALYCLQDLVTRYLTEETLQRQTQDDSTAGLQASWMGSEQTPSESLVTSEDEVGVSAGRGTSGEVGVSAGRGTRGEREEASPHSTPPRPQREAPLATDDTRDTVLQLNKAIARLRESSGYGVSHGMMQPPVVSPGPLDTSNSAKINTVELHEQIKTTTAAVIPLLKEHMAGSCSAELLLQIRQLVVGLTLSQMKQESPSIVEAFSRQLDTTLQKALQEYMDQMLKDCGESLLVEISEVLFNELAFFRLVQTMGLQRDPKVGFTSPSQSRTTTTGNEGEGEGRGCEREVDEQGAAMPVLQSLTAAVQKTVSDEQETLGKERDEELAREWSGVPEPSSPSFDGEQTVVVERSASDSKPVESVSCEEGEGEGGSSGSQTHTTTDTTPAQTTEREETPPTPIAAVSGTAGGSTALPTQSPPPVHSNAELEVQMKLEQQSTSGIAGILATMEQESELAGESEELPQPTGPSEAISEP